MKQERGYSTQWQKKKRNAKHSQQKNLFFFCQLWFYMLQSHNDLNHKLKGGQQTGGELTCTMTLTTNAMREKGTVRLTLNVSHTRLPKRKAPDCRHPDEVLNRTQ